jgi:hypothetical protein
MQKVYGGGFPEPAMGAEFFGWLVPEWKGRVGRENAWGPDGPVPRVAKSSAPKRCGYLKPFTAAVSSSFTSNTV